MKNQMAIETFNILSQVNSEKGYPVKFEYGLARLLNKLEPVVKSLNAVQTAKIDGQEAYDTGRQALLTKHAKKDEEGNPTIRPSAQGTEYVIEDYSKFNAQMEKLKTKHADVLVAIESRQDEIKELLEKDVEDFEPYKIKIKTLPLTEKGECRLTVLQLRYLIPFLDGDINDLPDPAE